MSLTSFRSSRFSRFASDSSRSTRSARSELLHPRNWPRTSRIQKKKARTTWLGFFADTVVGVGNNIVDAHNVARYRASGSIYTINAIYNPPN